MRTPPTITCVAIALWLFVACSGPTGEPASTPDAGASAPDGGRVDSTVTSQAQVAAIPDAGDSAAVQGDGSMPISWVQPMHDSDELFGLRQGQEQLDSLCARGHADAVADWACSGDIKSVTNLVDLQVGLAIQLRAAGAPSTPSSPGGQGAQGSADGFVMTGHSTSLVSRAVSSINPRLILVRLPGEELGMLVLAFTRGDRFVELVTEDRATAELRFYLVTFELPCDAFGPGCYPGDLLTGAVESDWSDLTVYDDSDLKNTPLDCRQCHQPDGPQTPKILRMQEFESPWTHWFYEPTRGGRALYPELRAALGSQGYAGITAPRLAESHPGVLTALLRHYGDQDQPNAFRGGTIEIQVASAAAAQGGNQPYDNHVAGSSAEWDSIYESARLGEAIPVPYHDVKVADALKLRKMTLAYKNFRAGTLPLASFPDIRQVFPDDPTLLAHMGFAPEPGASAEELLFQACSQCHNSRLDQTLTRARFNADISNLSAEELRKAAARVALPITDRSVMPPARFERLSEVQKRLLAKHLLAEANGRN